MLIFENQMLLQKLLFMGSLVCSSFVIDDYMLEVQYNCTYFKTYGYAMIKNISYCQIKCI